MALSNADPAAPSPRELAQNAESVGWQFVPQYYNFVNKSPERLHCFYMKNSTFIHGTEGEDGVPCFGQQEIHAKILAIGFKDCKVYIHSVDSQSSGNNGILIQVIGEMSNQSGPWKKFAQTFFLAEQKNGYFVLNDIFRFLKEESVEEDDDFEDGEDVVGQDDSTAAEEPNQTLQPPPQPPQAPVLAPPVVEEKTIEPEPQPQPTVPAPIIAEPTPSPVPPPPEPAPKAVELEVVETSLTPTPAPAPAEATPAVSPAAPQINGSLPAPTPAEVSAAPSSSSPAPAKLQPKQTAAPSSPAAPKQAAPKSWASLAASSSKAPTGAWGRAPAPAASPSQPPSSTITDAPAAKQDPPSPAASAPPQQSSPAPSKPTHPQAIAAMNAQTAQCFVKLNTWSPGTGSGTGAATSSKEINDVLLKKTLEERFGKIKEIDLVKQKACAFVEFADLGSARKAILASLPVASGGEGGIKVGAEGRVVVEVRKEKADRPKTQQNQQQPSTSASKSVNGHQSQQQQQTSPQQQQNRGQNEPRRGGGASGGRGRGSKPNAGRPNGAAEVKQSA